MREALKSIGDILNTTLYALLIFGFLVLIFKIMARKLVNYYGDVQGSTFCYGEMCRECSGQTEASLNTITTPLSNNRRVEMNAEGITMDEYLNQDCCFTSEVASDRDKCMCACHSKRINSAKSGYYVGRERENKYGENDGGDDLKTMKMKENGNFHQDRHMLHEHLRINYGNITTTSAACQQSTTDRKARHTFEENNDDGVVAKCTNDSLHIFSETNV